MVALFPSFAGLLPKLILPAVCRLSDYRPSLDGIFNGPLALDGMRTAPFPPWLRGRLPTWERLWSN